MDGGNENFPYRQLSGNEQKLLCLIYEIKTKEKLNVITKLVLVNYAGEHNFFENRTKIQIERSITSSLSSIQEISKKHFGDDKYRKELERYVISIPNVSGRQTGYALADAWLITTRETAAFTGLLVTNAENDRINVNEALALGINEVGLTEEEARKKIYWLIKGGYLQDEISKLRVTERLSLYERIYLAACLN